MPDSVRTAQAFLENLYTGELAKVSQNFEPTARTAFTESTLSALREQIIQLFGKPLRHAATRTSRTFTALADVVYLSWEFENDHLDARVVVNNANVIVAFSFEVPGRDEKGVK